MSPETKTTISGKPLKGLRVVVTRSKKQASQLTDKLTALGAEVFEFPVIFIAPPLTWEPLDNAIRHLKQYDWILFASANAVDSFVFRVGEVGLAMDELQDTKVAVIGPGTAASLQEFGLVAAFCPTEFVGEALVEQFPDYPNLSGVRILWPRTNVGRSFVVDKLKAAGARVDVVESYRTTVPPNQAEMAERLTTLLTKNVVDVVTLASAQTARNFSELVTAGLTKQLAEKNLSMPIGQEALRNALAGVTIATIGPETTQAAMQCIGKVDIEAREFTIDGLIRALIDYSQS